MLATHHRAHLIGLQLRDLNSGDPSIVESTTRTGCPFQPAIHRVLSYLLDSSNRGFVQTFDTQSRDLVEGRSSVLESMVKCPAVPTEGFPASLTSVSTALPPLGLVKAISNHGPGNGFPHDVTFLACASETLHGSWTLPKVNLLTQN